MFSKRTKNYGLPQWQNTDTPTWLTDMNTAFLNIDTNMKLIEEKANQGGELGERVDEVETNVANIATKIGTDVIDTIGTSITNALVNLKNAIDTATSSITSILNQIGSETITDIGSSITDALVRLNTKLETATTNITNITIKIGTDVIDTIGTSITNALVNLKNAIGATDITQIGITITNAIVNLKSSIDTLTQQIGNDIISNIGTSITNALVNLYNTTRKLADKIGNTPITFFGDSITDAISNVYNGSIFRKIEVVEEPFEQPNTFITNYLYSYNMGATTVINFDITNNYNVVYGLLSFGILDTTYDIKEMKTKVFIEENNIIKSATVKINGGGIGFEKPQNIAINSRIFGQLIVIVNREMF